MFTIHHVPDSFALFGELPANSYDLTITDPPYSAHCQANQMSGTTFKKWVNGELHQSGVPKQELSFPPLTDCSFARELVRVSKRWALSFCTIEDLGRCADVVQDNWVRGGLWYKPNSMGQLTGDRPAAAYEGLAIMHRTGEKMWNGRGSYAAWCAEEVDDETFWIQNGTRGEKERHPNQKPLALCLDLVWKFSQPGETIFDPFAGSGRIGEAAVLLGRNYVGWDWNPAWVEKARARCAAAQALAPSYTFTPNACRFPSKKAA